jgi:hypothetical protein
MSFCSRRAYDKQQPPCTGNDYPEQLGSRFNFRKNARENLAMESKEMKLNSTADLIQTAAARIPSWPNPKARPWAIGLRPCARPSSAVGAASL